MMEIKLMVIRNSSSGWCLHSSKAAITLLRVHVDKDKNSKEEELRHDRLCTVRKIVWRDRSLDVDPILYPNFRATRAKASHNVSSVTVFGSRRSLRSP